MTQTKMKMNINLVTFFNPNSSFSILFIISALIKKVIMTFDNDISLSSSSMSEYEKLRAKNISKNNARLRSLGLISTLEEQRSNFAALGEDDKAITTSTTTATIGNEKVVLAQPRPSSSSITKKRKSRVVDYGEASRKSLRLQGINVVVDSSTKTTMIEEERIERVKECREMRLRSAQVVFEAGLEVAAKENPTATYDHCSMRVRSMSEKGLGNRVCYACFCFVFIIYICICVYIFKKNITLFDTHTLYSL